MRLKYFFCILIILCFSYVVLAEEAKKTLTLEDMLTRLSKDWSVVKKNGEITKIEKEDERWKVDYTVFDVDVISGFLGLNLANNYIIKTDEKGVILYFLGTRAMVSTNKDLEFKHTLVFGANLIVSWPNEMDISQIKENDKVTLLFVSKKSSE